MEKYDYQALRELTESLGWGILVKEMEDRVKDIEDFILSPNLDDILGEKDPTEKLRVIAYKKAERSYLKQLIDLPNDLINTKIKI